MRKPLLSFIIPAYNAENYVDECTAVLLKDIYASGEQCEILIVENGSTDTTTSKSLKIMSENRNIVRVLHSKKGPSNARNEGMRVAEGQYFIFVDADDLWIPGSIKVICRLIRRFRADLYAFGYKTDAFEQNHDMEGKIAVADTPDKVEKRRAWMISRPMMRAQVWAKVYRADMIRQSGQYFDESIKFCEDGEYIVRLSKYCQKIVISGHLIYHYRYSAGSLMREYDENRIDEYVRAMETSEKVIAGESEIICRAFLEYVLCHLNLLLVRNVYSRQVSMSPRERDQKMRELCDVPVFCNALSKIDRKRCLSVQLLPELFLKSHMRFPAQVLCFAKALLNSRRERKADQ